MSHKKSLEMMATRNNGANLLLLRGHTCPAVFAPAAGASRTLQRFANVNSILVHRAFSSLLIRALNQKAEVLVILNGSKKKMIPCLVAEDHHPRIHDDSS